jgi:glycosyltransferase involved in cell wall biosynthesis
VVEAPELYAEGLFIALREDVPLVVRMHSSAAQLFPYLDRTGADVRATVRLENVAVRRADIVVSTAPNLAQAIHELGLDQAFTRPIIYPVPRRDVVTVEPDPDLVLFVGRLERRKNPGVLVAAAQRVVARRPGTRFRFIGSDTEAPGVGSYRAHLEQQARTLGVAEAVEFMGAVAQPGVAAEMAQAAVCAFPSRWESFGLVVAEAASIGRPVVVSDIPEFTDYVEDRANARVVAVDDADAWAEALIETLDHPSAARQRALRLREVIARRADPDHVAALAIESYEAAIARRRSR